jgi:HK97 gp10 family phage protein
MDTTMRPGAIRSLNSHPQVVKDCEAAAGAVADDAKAHAPRGAPPDPGAEGIHYEKVPGEPSTFHVSWEQEEFYMGFAEFGTEHERARPFLRPAADAPKRINK